MLCGFTSLSLLIVLYYLVLSQGILAISLSNLCMYVWTYVFMQVCTYMCMYVCMYVCMYMWKCVRASCVHKCVRACVHHEFISVDVRAYIMLE